MSTTKSTKSEPALHLDPADYHRWLMDQFDPPKLAFGGGDVAAWQRSLRAKVAALLGYDRTPAADRVPLRVRDLWTREHALGRIQRIVFTAEPHADVPAYVCIPRDARPPYTWFICLQGHSTGMHNSIAVAKDDEVTPIEVGGDRDFGLGAMKRGVAALCIEQRSFGYRASIGKIAGEHGCHAATMHALMLGKTLIGERVFDVDRAIDYLYTRDDVDRRRIGVMGNSGGGTVSLFAAAMLPRLGLAMPSCYFCTFRDSIMSIHHCMDNYVPGLLRWAEMADVMGLFAPRPVVLVAGKTDPIFPIKATKRAFAKLKAIYKAAGAEDRCQLVVGSEDHRFYAEQGWKRMLGLLR